jgi:hypothetical protein
MTRAEVKFQQAEDDPAKPRDGGYLSIDAPDGFSGFRPAANLHKAVYLSPMFSEPSVAAARLVWL